MPTFTYSARALTGELQTGEIDLPSRDDVIGYLRRQRLIPVKVEQRRVTLQLSFGSRIRTRDVVIFTRQFATMINAGLPLVQSLDILAKQSQNKALRKIIEQVLYDVESGNTLADSLRKHPKAFSDLYVNMVAAGEASGTLEQVLSRLADFLESQAKLKNKVTSALAYPAFMLLMGIATVSIMMVVVVPKVTAIFEDFERALPWYTRLLIFVSDVFANYWWLLGGLLVVGFIAFRRWKNTPKGRERWDRFTLDVPLFGPLILMVAVSRFARTLATLLRSGVPLLNAMEITRNVLGNTELMRVIEEARVSIREGESIAAPLKRSKRLPPIVTHMIAVGERSGQLEEMLENVADSYDAQVESKVQTLTSLLEPLLIVLLGSLSGGIAFAILMPLMQINEFVSG